MPRTRLPAGHPFRAEGRPSDLGYFPEPQPDEHLFSLISRFGRHAALSGFKTRELLFGDPDYRMRLDAPTSLGRFCSMFERPPLSGAAAVIADLTPHNFLVSYMPAAKREKISGRMRAPANRDDATPQIGEWNGGAGRELRFCSACHQDDLRNQHVRERYWRRLHQLQPVAVCTKHGKPLQRSSVRARLDTRGCDVVPTAANCPADAPAVASPDERGLSLLVVLAGRAADLLATPRPLEAPEALTESYRARAAAAGLVSRKGLSIEAAAVSFTETWGSALSAMPEVLATDGLPSWWLQRIFQLRPGPHPIEHPLPHLLVDIWLERAVPIAENDERVARLRRDRQASAGRGRIDGWRTRARDAELAASIAEVAAEIRSRVPEKRVTRAEIARTVGVGNLGSISEAQEHWPLTSDAIGPQLETPDDYTKRRYFRQLDLLADDFTAWQAELVMRELRRYVPREEVERLVAEYRRSRSGSSDDGKERIKSFCAAR